MSDVFLPADIDMRVKKARYRAGLTQKALSEKSGLTIEAISRIENNRNAGPPRLSTLRKIADATGVPVTTFTEV